ncbi:hypothetical protein [Nonomuraea sp. bgisy101]|uniref:hypothetical protein n=1 Tax=Nonomuraea sp. bgisy101 TaxID=3413784 RepID=UPI003D71C38C
MTAPAESPRALIPSAANRAPLERAGLVCATLAALPLSAHAWFLWTLREWLVGAPLVVALSLTIGVPLSGLCTGRLLATGRPSDERVFAIGLGLLLGSHVLLVTGLFVATQVLFSV